MLPSNFVRIPAILLGSLPDTCVYPFATAIATNSISTGKNRVDSMGRDRSLEEFMNGSDATRESDGDNTTPDGETDESRETETESEVVEQPSTLTIHPARSTMAWTGDGAACDTCDDIVQRRWRDGDGLVCGACKEW